MYISYEEYYHRFYQIGWYPSRVSYVTCPLSKGKETFEGVLSCEHLELLIGKDRLTGTMQK